MKKLALFLALFSCGCMPLLSYLYSLGVPELVPYPTLVLCLPALLLGLGSWWRVNSFARSWPVLACVSVMFVGMFWVDPTERGRAILVFAGVACSLPIAALIVETRTCRFCARIFIGVAVINFLLLVYLQGMFPSGARFGNLVLNDILISDPNSLATQLGVATVLIISLMQSKKWQSTRNPNGQRNEGAVLWIALAALVLGILLTASRSGIVSLFAVLGLFSLSCNTKVTHRIAIFATGALAVLVIFSSENRISTRFQDAEGLAKFGNRLPIWETGMWILESDRDYFVYGVGTGGIDKAIAEHSLHEDTFRRGKDDIFRRASHNAYLEWLVSHGLLGVPLGLWLILAATRLARRLDKFDSSFSRGSLLAYCAIVSIVVELYRLPLASGLCAILLSMLSGPFLSPWPSHNSRSRHRHNIRAGVRVCSPRHLGTFKANSRTY